MVWDCVAAALMLNHQHSTASPACTSQVGPLPMNGASDGEGSRFDQQNTAGSPHPDGIDSTIEIGATGTSKVTVPSAVQAVAANPAPSETVNSASPSGLWQASWKASSPLAVAG